MRWSFFDPSWSVKEWASRGALGISIIHSFTYVSFSATLFSDLGLEKGRGGGGWACPNRFPTSGSRWSFPLRFFRILELIKVLLKPQEMGIRMCGSCKLLKFEVLVFNNTVLARLTLLAHRFSFWCIGFVDYVLSSKPALYRGVEFSAVE